MNLTRNKSIVTFQDKILLGAKKEKFTIFLCGPGLKTKKSSAKLRKKIAKELKKEGFEVIFGEDDGLKDSRIRMGQNAQDHELEFIHRECNAILLLADSAGSLCELGLFSWHFVHGDGVIKREDKIDQNTTKTFIVLANQKHKRKLSYFNEGPIKSLKENGGSVYFVDYDQFDTDEIISIMTTQRINKFLYIERQRER